MANSSVLEVFLDGDGSCSLVANTVVVMPVWQRLQRLLQDPSTCSGRWSDVLLSNTTVAFVLEEGLLWRNSRLPPQSSTLEKITHHLKT